ncbi:MAG: hypothetical protein PUP46_07915 [Endozoicomonas sp. (ex Botrylloides leachii)]|nr:hypothetical protein [Endozoicomonas sp. (ex Botrylloides leachii)]
MISEQKQIRTLLEERIRQFKAWSDSKPKADGQLTVRKYPCKAELLEFRLSKEQQPMAQAKIKITFSNQRQLWAAAMQLSIFTRTVRKPGYEDLKPGIYFHTDPGSGKKPELIKSYKIIINANGAYEPADFNEWYRYWLQRMLKDSAVKTLFAHKELVSDNEIEAEQYLKEALKQE